MTPHRKLVHDILREEKLHLSAQGIWELARKRGATVSLATVYNSLHHLVEHGFVREFDVADGCTMYDARTDTHAHLVCSSCGTVKDIDLEKETVLLERLARVGSGFLDVQPEVTIRGVCPACQPRTGRSPARTRN